MREFAAILGKPVRDVVTGFRGIAESVSFDLYGCVQVVVNAGFSETGERQAHWFDHSRLEEIAQTPVMVNPWEGTARAADIASAQGHGPAHKPVR